MKKILGLDVCFAEDCRIVLHNKEMRMPIPVATVFPCSDLCRGATHQPQLNQVHEDILLLYPDQSLSWPMAQWPRQDSHPRPSTPQTRIRLPRSIREDPGPDSRPAQDVARCEINVYPGSGGQSRHPWKHSKICSPILQVKVSVIARHQFRLADLAAQPWPMKRIICCHL